MSNTINGMLVNAKFISENDNNWATWAVTFDDGNSFRVLVPPDAKGVQLKEDMNVEFFWSKADAWVLTSKSSDKILGKAPQNGQTVRKQTAKVEKKDVKTYDDYWKNKTAYEQDQRDPKIEWQEYFHDVIKVYAAAIPHMAEPPTTIQDVDAYIDDAYAKAEAIFQRKNRAK